MENTDNIYMYLNTDHNTLPVNQEADILKDMMRNSIKIEYPEADFFKCSQFTLFLIIEFSLFYIITRLIIKKEFKLIEEKKLKEYWFPVSLLILVLVESIVLMYSGTLFYNYLNTNIVEIGLGITSFCIIFIIRTF
jgi:hypothetical protein